MRCYCKKRPVISCRVSKKKYSTPAKESIKKVGKTLHAQPTIPFTYETNFPKKKQYKHLHDTIFFFEMEENIFTIIFLKESAFKYKEMCGSTVR